MRKAWDYLASSKGGQSAGTLERVAKYDRETLERLGTTRYLASSSSDGKVKC